MNKSYYNFNNSLDISSINTRLSALELKINSIKLMYRRPGSSNYENITNSLDDIFKKLDYLDSRIKNLEKSSLEI